jgi:catechol 2,3-dioxygenase-like lactoylglutathione lyase family enzyme
VLATNNLVAFVPTTDAVRAKVFYGDTLGLRFVSDDGFALVFDVNGIMLRVAKAGPFTPAPYTILGWEVSHIERVALEFAQNGIRFENFGLPGQDENGIWTAPTGDKVAWFKDPDGNVLSVSQHVAG